MSKVNLKEKNVEDLNKDLAELRERIAKISVLILQELQDFEQTEV